jgi:hypothetical protein
MSEAEALAAFHCWAEARRRRSGPAAFFVRYIAAVSLMAISRGCVWLERIVAPTV